MNQRSSINIYNQDCMEAMKQMSDNEFDLAIVDPPYGIKRDGHRGDPNFGWKKHTFKGWDNARPKSKYFTELFRVSKNQIIWGANYFTSYIPPSKGWVYWDKGQKLTMSDGELAFTSFDRALRSITINRVEILTDISIHPTQKPVKLYKWLLTNYAKEGDKILDTHLGSGSIAIACWDLKFDLTGYEIDKEYYDNAIERIERHKRQLNLF